jgi:hypothetical protein
MFIKSKNFKIIVTKMKNRNFTKLFCMINNKLKLNKINLFEI